MIRAPLRRLSLRQRTVPFLHALQPDPTLLSQTANILFLLQTTRKVRDMAAPTRGRSWRRLRRALAHGVRAACHVRYAFTARVRAHDWIVAFDGKRARPLPGESPHQHLTRVCRTNRPQSLPSLIGIKETSRIHQVDMSRRFGHTDESYGALAFLCGLAGPAGLARLASQALIGYATTRDPQAAVIYAGLDLVERRHLLTQCGFLTTTSSTWLTEVLRTGFLTARPDIDVVEVLHGASTVTIAPYFARLHELSRATPIYVNLIADLPRFAPQSDHLLTDEDGEIACNIRLWQDRKGRDVAIPRNLFETPAIAFIGGASNDPDYAASSYFAKEIALLKALRRRLSLPIRYCVHPAHGPDLQARLIGRVRALGAQTTGLSTQDDILAARITVGGFSTSLVEAALLGREVFAYEDMGALFVPEIAAMLTFTPDIEALADNIAEACAAVSATSPEDDFNLVSALARRRYGLEMRLTDEVSPQ
ncbi:hypothetical protein [Gymnodinialimonas ceratoperidinii]|uniref:Glycosyltransferase n=1 Tax=Gymnodinialimonas ceratoperidinii TaxID=2856823 RepID=A0A8F6TVD0_9RHOB|nr:hypothetical protein [Gymnodinialimonas ceratoperidinii]QXT39390.1 hypothetical protein KYE46_15905 [Gymnodinialimonas ceratoperidinii]